MPEVEERVTLKEYLHTVAEFMALHNDNPVVTIVIWILILTFGKMACPVIFLMIVPFLVRMGARLFYPEGKVSKFFEEHSM